jgi:hypothetical protein
MVIMPVLEAMIKTDSSFAVAKESRFPTIASIVLNASTRLEECLVIPVDAVTALVRKLVNVRVNCPMETQVLRSI